MKRNKKIALMLAMILMLTAFTFTSSFAATTKKIGTDSFTVRINNKYKFVDLGLGPEYKSYMIKSGRTSKLIQISSMDAGVHFSLSALRTAYKSLTEGSNYTSRKVISIKPFKRCNAIKFKFKSKSNGNTLYTCGIIVSKGTKASYIVLMSSAAYQSAEFNKILKTFKFK